MWSEARLDLPPAAPVPPVPDRPLERLAGVLQVEVAQIWCGALTDVIGGLPAGRVVLAQPTAPEIAVGIVASGRKYVDAGRNHRFAVHPAGWRYALQRPEIESAWLMAPNEPLGRLPHPDRLSEAYDASLTVVLDARYSLYPEAPAHTALPKTVELRTWEHLSGHPLGSVVAIGPPELLAAMGRANRSDAGEHARWLRSSAIEDRRSAWLRRRRLAGLSTDALSAGVWRRVDGVGSADVAHEHVSARWPGRWRLTRSAQWTWRDGVRLSPLEPGAQGEGDGE